MRDTLLRYAVLALLVVGSATLLFSCGDSDQSQQYDYESIMTERSENRTITMTENGKRSYSFFAPLIEGYSLAQNPYQKFDKGIKMTTYTSDSLSLVDATITADNAIYYDKQKLWEAKNNVEIVKYNRKEGDTVVTDKTIVRTDQLYWDARTKKIYSNVKTRVLQADGWHEGIGFEADEDLKNIHFRKYKSEMEFDFTPTEENSAEGEKPRDKDATKKKSSSSKSNQNKRPSRTPSDRPSSVSSSSVSPKQTKTPSRPSTPSRQVPQGDVKLNNALSSDVSPGLSQGPSSAPRGGVQSSSKGTSSSKTTSPSVQSRTKETKTNVRPSTTTTSSAPNQKAARSDAPKSATSTKK